MSITLSRGSLPSHRARTLATGDGLRIIDTSLEIANGEDNRGLIQRGRDFISSILGDRLTNFGFKIGGWILKRVSKFASWSFTEAWGWLTSRAINLWAFDWNTTDAELEQMNKQANLSLAAIWGTVFGSAVGWVTSVALGYGVSLLMPVIGSKLLATKVAALVAEEGIQEVTATIGGAISATLGAMADNTIRTAFIGWRRLLQYGQVGFAQLVGGPAAGEAIADSITAGTSWGGDKAPEWSFSDGWQKVVQKFPQPVQVFIDAAAEEAVDAVFEAGFIVANALDEAAAGQQAEKARNPDRGLVLYPDRTNNNERLLFTGEQDEVIAQAQAQLNNSRVLQSKDVGELAAIPLEEIVTPLTSRRTLHLTWQEYDKPPYTRNSKRSKRVTLKVSDAKAGISFNDLKVAIRPFTAGGTRATMKLSNGRQFAVYGSSKAECDGVLRALLTLTTAEAVRTVYTDVNAGVPQYQRKEIKLVYPSKAVMNYIVPTPTPGNVVRRSQKMDIWRDEPLGISVFTQGS